MSSTLPPPGVYDAAPTTPAGIRRAEAFKQRMILFHREELLIRQRQAFLKGLAERDDTNRQVADAMEDPPAILLGVRVSRILAATRFAPQLVERLLERSGICDGDRLGAITDTERERLALELRTAFADGGVAGR